MKEDIRKADKVKSQTRIIHSLKGKKPKDFGQISKLLDHNIFMRFFSEYANFGMLVYQ